MRRFGLHIINRMRLPLLLVVAITSTSFVCFGEGDPVKTPERISTMTRQSKVNIEDRMQLDQSLRGLESRYTESEEIARKAAREYREEAEQESANAKELAKLKQALDVAVSTSFKNQLLLEKTRLQISERDLIDQQTRHSRRESLAERIIARRVADLMYGEDLGWSIARKTTDAYRSHETGDGQSVGMKEHEAAINALPNFATPQELLDYLEKTKNSDDVTIKLRSFIELLDQDELNRFAGVCLRTASVVRSGSKLAEGFSALAPDGQNAELIRVGRELETLVKDARLSKPPRRAQSAYESICAPDISMFQVMLNAQAVDTQTPTVDAGIYSAKLRKAAGVLKDPIQFSIDFVTLMSEFDNSDEKKETQQIKKPAEWDITIEGDRATVIDRSGETYTPGVALATNRIELVKTGDTWKISNIMTDEMMIELQRGIKASKSSGQSDLPAK